MEWNCSQKIREILCVCVNMQKCDILTACSHTSWSEFLYRVGVCNTFSNYKDYYEIRCIDFIFPVLGESKHKVVYLLFCLYCKKKEIGKLIWYFLFIGTFYWVNSGDNFFIIFKKWFNLIWLQVHTVCRGLAKYLVKSDNFGVLLIFTFLASISIWSMIEIKKLFFLNIYLIL